MAHQLQITSEYTAGEKFITRTANMGNAIAKVTQMFPSKSEPPKEILLTGNYNSGKTTILYKLKSARDEVETKIPTIGEKDL